MMSFGANQVRIRRLAINITTTSPTPKRPIRHALVLILANLPTSPTFASTL